MLLPSGDSWCRAPIIRNATLTPACHAARVDPACVIENSALHFSVPRNLWHPGTIIGAAVLHAKTRESRGKRNNRQTLHACSSLPNVSTGRHARTVRATA
eukprot:6795042-Alexandrium_andersonii.AAC.2